MPIEIASTTAVISPRGGLVIFDEALRALNARRMLTPCMPSYKKRPIAKGYDKLRALLLGLVAGADCLDDMRSLGEDPGFDAISGGVNCPATYGAFLRSFSLPQWRCLQERLGDIAFKLRAALVGKDPMDFILDVDSTHHEQTAVKMEGLGYDYANHWGLSSLQAFDQFGFQYWMEVREGNAHTANGAAAAVGSILRRVPRMQKRIVRGDSGYCNHDVFNVCANANADFVIAMRENMFEPLLGQIRSWTLNRKVRFRDGREAEVGTAIYQRKQGRQVLRVLVMRAKKVGQKELFGDPYDYKAFVTSFGAHQMRDEEIIKFYQDRGNAENFIKELKGGFDMHHFPCQKLLANRVYGVIAALAYNLHRFAARLLERGTARFSKMIRFRMVHLACQVVRKARRVTFRFHEHKAKEVAGWINQTYCKLLSG
jgi:hypothetical protein